MNSNFIRNVFCVAVLACSMSACTKQLKQDPVTDAQRLNANGAAAAAAPAVDPDGAALRKLLNAYGPSFEIYRVSGEQGGKIVSKRGTIYSISPNSFVTKSGAPVTGPVTVAIKEIRDASNMIFADRPTRTNNGQALESFGEFFVRANDAGGQPLNLRKDSAIAVQVPVKPGNFDRVPMWGGDSTITRTLSGFNHLNQPTTVTQDVAVVKGIDWTPNGQFALFNGTTLNFRLDSLIKWFNCDRLTGNNPRTTVLGYFTNFYNPNTNTSYMGEEPSMLFFKARNVNSIVKFYNVILNPAPGFQGFLSYQTSVPVNQQGTFLAITSLNGNFYAEQKDVVISAPPAGQNYTSVSFNLVQVSATDLVNLINSMNTK
ncbi:hypothetical protein [Chitinophaga solisilvae]|uniref:DUF5689 domain-containing protein n=1 Tax=Chitinophaga solisilvae TaxID=1233460 RepID=A0A9Q5GP71_9BACT|nr:hypothetical protein [Chitinophaga solisilvae]NSL85372.1 hypothetical protein [Chitinophaga solisilvae]